jgi:NitT/TauT family transport system ATP-binding protein
MSEITLHVRNLRKTYEDNNGSNPVEAVRDVSFDLHENEFVSIVGPSGCGKTTILKAIVSLVDLTDGTIERATNTDDRDLLLVFQDYNRSLLPWRTVSGNVRLGLESRDVPRDLLDKKTLQGLKSVGLDNFARHFPWQLSGGMQQRVALARAMVCEPRMLLMDEPFGSIDALNRSALEDDLLRLWQKTGISVLLVTHDIDEAIYLSQRILVLTERPSRVQAEVQVNLPYPRRQLETRNSPEFGRLRQRIYSMLGRVSRET